MRVLLAGAALGLLVVSCANPAPKSSPAPVPSPAPIGKVTLSESSCTLQREGETLREGPGSLAVTNTTQIRVAVSFGRISDGHTYEELSAHIRREREAAEDGAAMVGTPSYFLGAIPLDLGPARSGARTVDLTAGTWAIVCVRMYERIGQLRPFALVGPIEVKER